MEENKSPDKTIVAGLITALIAIALVVLFILIFG